MLLQNATENLVSMQQGNGGDAKKNSLSISSTRSAKVGYRGNRRIKTNRKLKTAMNQAQATKATTQKTKTSKVKKQTKAEKDAQIRADRAAAMAVRFGAQIASNNAANEAIKARKAAEGSTILAANTAGFVKNQNAKAKHKANR